LVRNVVVFHRFFPGTTLVGTNLMEGLFIPTQDASKGIVASIPPEVLAMVRGRTEMEANDILLHEALKFLWRNPTSWLLNGPGKVIKMWFNASDWRKRFFLYYPTTNRNHYVQYSLLIPNVILFAFAGLAIFRYRGRWLVLATPILLALAFFTFAETFLVSVGRHCLKLMPALIVLAAFGLHQVFTHWRASTSR